MPRAWTEDEDARLREALRLNPTVGAASIEHRFPMRSRPMLAKRLRALRGCPIHDLREPSEPSKRRALRRASGIAPPLGYSPDQIEWAKATAMDKTAPEPQRAEAAMILGYHAGRR